MRLLATRNIRIYTLLEIANSSTFIMGNWLFFWLRIMTYGEVGLIDALSFAFGMFMEIPTGAVADMIGKKRTMIAAMLCNMLGFFIMGAADTKLMLILGFLFTQTGWAFYSGAAEALVYDSLKADGEESRFERVMSRIGVISTANLMISSLLGGVLYHMDNRFPHYAWGVMFALGFIASLWLIEPPSEAEKFSVAGYFRQLSMGFRHLAAPAIRSMILPVIVIRGAGYMFQMGLIQPILALNFGFGAEAQSVTGAIMFLGAALGSAIAPQVRQIVGESRGLWAAGILIAVGYASGMFPWLGMWGIIGLLMIRFGSGIAAILASVALNQVIPSHDRATTLSTVALFMRLPYVLSAMIAGSLAENGQIGLFCIAVAGIIMVASLPLLRKVVIQPLPAS